MAIEGVKDLVVNQVTYHANTPLKQQGREFVIALKDPRTYEAPLSFATNFLLAKNFTGWSNSILSTTEKSLASAIEQTAATRGGRAFHSGVGSEARAIEQGFQTLGQTRAGQNLQNLISTKNIPWSEAEPMWKRLSVPWANGIPEGGIAPVFLNNPRADAIWFEVELPILLSKDATLIYK